MSMDPLSDGNEEDNGRIPFGFDESWANSDVVIQCNGSFFHVNKMTLATFSPVWNSLFFSEFAEKNKDIVDIEIDDGLMLNILWIIHNVDRNFTRPFSFWPKMLRNLYLAADKYDIPLIRDMVKQQLQYQPPCDAYRVCSELNLEKEKNECIQRMTESDVKRLLNTEDDKIVFSLDDVRGFLGKLNISGIDSSKKKTEQPSKDEKQTIIPPNDSGDDAGLPHRSWSIPKDFDIPWATSDTILKTNGETAKDIHVNKSVLATFSPFFHSLFSADDSKPFQDGFDINVEYDVILEILRILHHVDRKFTPVNHIICEANMLSKMYAVALKLEIEVIIRMCKQQLPLAKPIVKAFEAAIRHGLDKEKTLILNKMTMEEIDQFLQKNRTPAKTIFSPSEMTYVLEKSKEQQRILNELNKKKERSKKRRTTAGLH